MKLYSFFRSSAAFRVRIALALKGLPYETVPIHLTRGEHRAEAFRGVNPQRRVPALVLDDGTVLIQSLAIIEYLEEVHPRPPLLPADPGARARARILMHYADNPYEGAAGALARELLIKPMQGGVPDQEAAARARVELDQCLERLERATVEAIAAKDPHGWLARFATAAADPISDRR